MNEHFTTECIEKIDPSFIEEARSFSPSEAKEGCWKRKAIKYSVIFLGIALLLTITIVWPSREQKQKYSVEKVDGQYRIHLGTQFPSKNGFNDVTNALTVYNPLHRNSIREMEKAFRNGNFTNTELAKLAYAANEYGTLCILDLDNLIEPIFPENIIYHVEFTATLYLCVATDEESEAKITLKDFSQHDFAHFTQNDYFAKTVRIPADAHNAEDLLQKAYYNTGYTEGAACFYIIEGTGNTYYVIEYYDSADQLAIPSGLEIYTEPNEPGGHYLKIQILNPKQRPDIAWLAQFGCKPYEP
jgi:hypothetical protein